MYEYGLREDYNFDDIDTPVSPVRLCLHHKGLMDEVGYPLELGFLRVYEPIFFT